MRGTSISECFFRNWAIAGGDLPAASSRRAAMRSSVVSTRPTVFFAGGSSGVGSSVFFCIADSGGA